MSNLDKIQLPDDNNEYTLMDGTVIKCHKADWDNLPSVDKENYTPVCE